MPDEVKKPITLGMLGISGTHIMMHRRPRLFIELYRMGEPVLSAQCHSRGDLPRNGVVKTSLTKPATANVPFDSAVMRLYSGTGELWREWVLGDIQLPLWKWNVNIRDDAYSYWDLSFAYGDEKYSDHTPDYWPTPLI